MGFYKYQGIITFYTLKSLCCDNQKVTFAPFHIDSSCSAFLPSTGHMGERLKADLRVQGRAVCGIPSCTLFRGAQLKFYFKHHVITLCGSVCTCTPLHVELFICLLHFQTRLIWRNTGVRAKQWLFKVGIWLRQRKVAWSGKQSLTWHYLQEEPAISSNPLKREWGVVLPKESFTGGFPIDHTGII